MKLKAFSTALACSVFSFAAPALAQTPGGWVEVAQSQSGDRLFVKADSIHTNRHARPFATRYRMKIEYSRTFNGASKFSASYTAFCETGTQKANSLTTYDRFNNILKSVDYGAQTTMGDFRNMQAPLEQVTPNTLAGAAFKYVCSAQQAN